MNVLQTIERLQNELSCGDIAFVKIPAQPGNPVTGQPPQAEGRAIICPQRIFTKGPNVAPSEARIVQIGTDYATLLNEVVEMAEHFHEMAGETPANVSRLNSQ